MKYIYLKEAKEPIIEIKGELFKYLFKVRRHKVRDEIYFRNLKDYFLYLYRVVEIKKKEAILELIAKEKSHLSFQKELIIGWCIIDPKEIEKSISMLNEIGVKKIVFIYCKKSQRNFKINFERLKKILIASSQQCGRENIMEIEVVDSLYKFKESYPDSYMLNFSDRIIQKELFNIKEVVVGPEGGFDKEEVNLYKDKIVGFDTPYILKSQTAVVAISSKILL